MEHLAEIITGLSVANLLLLGGTLFKLGSWKRGVELSQESLKECQVDQATTLKEHTTMLNKHETAIGGLLLRWNLTPPHGIKVPRDEE